MDNVLALWVLIASTAWALALWEGARTKKQTNKGFILTCLFAGGFTLLACWAIGYLNNWV